jgi:hypothetical protein
MYVSVYNSYYNLDVFLKLCDYTLYNERRSNGTEIQLLEAQLALMKGEVVESSKREEDSKIQLAELTMRLEMAEAEAASVMGRIVAEKESLSGDRDLLLQQLSKAATEAVTNKEIGQF